MAGRLEAQRHRALRDVAAAAPAATTQQASVERLIREAHGSVLEHDLLTGALVAEVPRGSLRTLTAHPQVASIERAPVERELGLEHSTAAVGAPSFWNVGNLGGRGPADSVPVDLAILHDKIEEEHPAFAGVTFQRPSDAPVGTSCGQFVNGCEHGTEVASLAISRGAAGCVACAASDKGKRGVVPELDTVLDAQASNVSVDDGAWALGFASFGVPGAADPAEVMSSSHGSVAPTDDSGSLRGVDKLISAYGALIAYPGGNEGPARAVNEDCIAYNTLCMGGFTPRGTVDPADDLIEDFSSRGPTPGGRKKPDLVGVATSEFANQHWIRDGRLWKGGSGTSLAAPQGAGAAALLAGSGIAAPIAQKAILVNSARQGRATPVSAMGTQAGWQADWGWGALDLDAALKERANLRMAEIAGGDAHFYRANVQATGDRATLVWNRRAVGCINPGCDTTALTLTNLQLEQLDPSTGATEASSASAIDNVEQVRAPSAGDVIYKVKAASAVDGLPGEPYALTARRALTPLVTPRPHAQVTVSTTAARPGDPITVVASVTNPSPDLSAEAAAVTLELPPGVELAPGSAGATQSIGTLAPNAHATLSWTVRAGGEATNRIAVRASGTRFGETFESDDSATFVSDGVAPTVSVGVPAGRVSDPAIPVTWSATDSGVGVRDHTVEVSADGAPFEPWLTATDATAATYTGTPGRRYRFRVRATDLLGATSEFVTSSEVEVAALAEPPPPAVPPTPTIVKVGPALRVRSIARRGSRVEIRGTLARPAFRAVTLELRGKANRRRVLRRAQTFPRAGRFKVALRLPGRVTGRLTVRYVGDERLDAAAVRVRLRGI